MENLIKEILGNRAARSKEALISLIAIAFNVGHPWGG